MSTIYGKWSVEDVRNVIRGLDEKTGMNGAALSINLSPSLGDGNTLGYYCHNDTHTIRGFAFSLNYFNDEHFKDLAAVDVIRHEKREERDERTKKE